MDGWRTLGTRTLGHGAVFVMGQFPMCVVFFFFFFLGEERKAGPSMRGSGGIVCELVDARVGRYFWGSNFLGC